MTHAKRFTLVVSLLALTFTPALLADEATSDPSILDTVVNAIVDILVGDPEAAEPPAETEAGPNIIFIG